MKQFLYANIIVVRTYKKAIFVTTKNGVRVTAMQSSSRVTDFFYSRITAF